MNRQTRIGQALTEAFSPTHLVVENESSMHNVPPGSETHFKVLIVSGSFEGMARIKRHRAVNDRLRNEFACGLHALTLRAIGPSEWTADQNAAFSSPKCLGGSKT